MSIFVTQSFLPPFEEYVDNLRKIWDKKVLTNQGPFLKDLEGKLKEYLGVSNIQFLGNGTIALQLAIRALDIKAGGIITTPFSYVATCSSILWENCTPIFCDIEPNNFTIDADKLEAAIKNSKIKPVAIMAVHVFGYACDVEKIQSIADKYKLKVIYDGAHAFSTKFKGRSLLDYGDISTLSFHATKLFHTGEGGACIVKDKFVADKLDLLKRFGHNFEDHMCLGINGKNSEFHAAMGITNLPYVKKIIAERKKISKLYDKLLPDIQKPQKQDELEYNYAYYPVVFKSEEELLEVFKTLNANDIFPRRYFYPSLNTLPYVKFQSCKVSEDISKRIACLPLYVGLEEKDVKRICELVLTATSR
jgi:dTDP-4-amino-4,6-dideoxygalactose transaminase